MRMISAMAGLPSEPKRTRDQSTRTRSTSQPDGHAAMSEVMTGVAVDEPGYPASPKRADYRRHGASRRGDARRQDLLDRVADDLAINGLVDFSLRRAARAAGTTHKVLLYYFDGADDLLAQAVLQLRNRRISRGLAAATHESDGQGLAARVRAIWPVLIRETSRVLEQAIGLAMYDPQRYARLGRDASRQYLPPLQSLCPADWSEQRKRQVAELILATLRGFLVERLTSGDSAGVDAGFEALLRALEREEAADA
jgi:DNA-binding transcriptional regulator YbjK